MKVKIFIPNNSMKMSQNFIQNFSLCPKDILNLIIQYLDFFGIQNLRFTCRRFYSLFKEQHLKLSPIKARLKSMHTDSNAQLRVTYCGSEIVNYYPATNGDYLFIWLKVSPIGWNHYLYLIAEYETDLAYSELYNYISTTTDERHDLYRMTNYLFSDGVIRFNAIAKKRELLYIAEWDHNYANHECWVFKINLGLHLDRTTKGHMSGELLDPTYRQTKLKGITMKFNAVLTDKPVCSVPNQWSWAYAKVMDYTYGSRINSSNPIRDESRVLELDNLALNNVNLGRDSQISYFPAVIGAKKRSVWDFG